MYRYKRRKMLSTETHLNFRQSQTTQYDCDFNQNTKDFKISVLGERQRSSNRRSMREKDKTDSTFRSLRL